MLFMMSSVDHVTSHSLAVDTGTSSSRSLMDPTTALFDDPEKGVMFEFLLDWLHAQFPEPMAVRSGNS
uniref:Uncharacterized protein n=1 Tax=Globisporangium ultimum (strain ATCC 200006 / CBS 805.95 / DAOM BR144) TaxID=431595 RepID=K3WQY1_GLOUD